MSKRSGKPQEKVARVAQSSKRKQFGEFLQKILDALKRADGFQEAEELVAELKSWAGSYLPAFMRQIEEAEAGERLELLDLLSHLEDPEAIPHLERLIFEWPTDVAAKRRAAEILQQLGSPLEVGMAESLNNAAAILQGIPNFKPASFHGSHPLFVKFVRLPPALRRATLVELASSAPQVALHIIELICSREHRSAPETIDALVLLEEPRAAKILQEFLETGLDKETERRVRRALYRLKSRGVAMEEKDLAARHEGIFRPLVTPPQAFMSIVHDSGTRVVWLAKPVPGAGRLFFQAVVHDERGLLDFTAVELSVRSFRSYMDEITKRDPETPVAEVPAEYAARLIEDAYHLSQERKEDIPQDYPIHRRQVAELLGEEPPNLEKRLGEAHMEPADGLTPEEMRKLLDRPEFAGWVVGEEEIAPYVEEVEKSVLESRLIVSRVVRQEQLDAVCRKAAAALFHADRLRRLVKRLVDTSYVLAMTDRKEAARSALGVAKSLGRLDGDPAQHPFLYEMVFRSVAGLLSRRSPAQGKEPDETARPEDRAKPEEPSRIITPAEFGRTLSQ